MNYRSTLRQQTKILEQKFKDQCIIAQDGGLFLTNPELLATLKHINETNQWVLDINQRPIMINNIDSFYKQAYNVYYTALSEYGILLAQLNSQRSVETILDL